MRCIAKTTAAGWETACILFSLRSFRFICLPCPCFCGHLEYVVAPYLLLLLIAREPLPTPSIWKAYARRVYPHRLLHRSLHRFLHHAPGCGVQLTSFSLHIRRTLPNLPSTFSFFLSIVHNYAFRPMPPLFLLVFGCLCWTNKTGDESLAASMLFRSLSVIRFPLIFCSHFDN